MNFWHSEEKETVLNELQTQENGLSKEQAEKRLVENGQNKLDEAKKKSLLYKFLIQFKNIMVIVLLAAAVVSAAVAIFKSEPEELIDAGIILAIVIINAVIGVVQENKAEAALEALQNMSKPFVKVRRDGEVIKIVTTDVVVGDIVLLEAGDVVSCDMRLTQSASLKIEEAALTGESLPVEKSVSVISDQKAPLGDRHNMAFSSSVVTYGRGEGVCVATGMNAEIGKIAKMLSEADNSKTPLQKKMDKTGKFLSIGILGIAALIFVISLFTRTINVDSVVESFMTAVAIAVAAIPEGLTAAITIIMALGVQKMSKKKAIIRKLPAVETLGSTQIICSDKTGTLTLNKMTVKSVFTNSQFINDEDGNGYEYSEILNCMVLCNDTNAKFENGTFSTLGDPTETALIDYAYLKGVNKIELNSSIKRVNELPFDSDRKLMSTVNQMKDGLVSYTKGAPDMLLKRCSKILDGDKVRAITEQDKINISQANSQMALKALRVLAFAKKVEKLDDMKSLEEEMIFIGLVGMIDPPREEVKQAVKTCKKAGMRAIMITGDHRDTAYAIAKELGIVENEKQVITGVELDKFSDKELIASVDKYRVYARVSPEHKVRIVKAWRAKGKVVAMTGDGVNDAPSIKIADIGIGMGITGTDVTKGAADMVLADDNFATIVVAVEEGRKIYNNIQKTVQFLLAANVAEVLALFIATILLPIFFPGQGIVFLFPIQILWVNLVTDSLPALALGIEPAEKNVMEEPPRDNKSSSLFAGKVGINIFYQGIIQTIIVLAVFFIGTYALEASHNVATSMAFVTLCLVQLFHCFNVKSFTQSVFSKNLFKNKFMWLSFAIGIALTLGVALIPGLNTVFKVVDMNWLQWLIAVGLAFSVIPIIEVVKLVTRIVQNNKKKKEQSLQPVEA